MSKSRSNSLQNKRRKPSRDTVVNWGALLSLIANELDICIRELRERRCGILEVRQEYFTSDMSFDEPSDKGLRTLATVLGGLENGIGCVMRRFDQFRAKLFQKLATDAISDGKEEFEYFDLDSE